MEADRGEKSIIIAKVLNHSATNVDPVTSVYTRHPLSVEKRAALETLETPDRRVVTAKDQRKVVPFRAEGRDRRPFGPKARYVEQRNGHFFSPVDLQNH